MISESECTAEGHWAFDWYRSARLVPHVVACPRCGRTERMADDVGLTVGLSPSPTGLIRISPHTG